MTGDRMTVSIFLHIDTGVILIGDVNTISLPGSSRNEGVSDFKAVCWKTSQIFRAYLSVKVKYAVKFKITSPFKFGRKLDIMAAYGKVKCSLMSVYYNLLCTCSIVCSLLYISAGFF